MGNDVLVILPLQGRTVLSPSDAEALDAAAEFAARFDGELSCLLLSDYPEAVVEQALSFPIARVFTMRDERFRSWNGDLVVTSAAECITATNARFVILGRDIATLELAPRLAARMSGASVVGVTNVDVDDDGTILVEATAFGGAARATYQVMAPPPLILGIAARRPGSATYPLKVDRPTTALPVPSVVGRVRIVEAASGRGSRLEDARYVVSGGRGLGEAKNFTLVRELAHALGGLPGASRAIVDSGWASPDEQVGLTGSIVAPELYIAAGISGASQHMAGCSNAKVLCAINTDERAAIFTYARFGIVDDCKAVLAELIALAGMLHEE
jgi:electron transfer flavoprotein alpha subunit